MNMWPEDVKIVLIEMVKNNDVLWDVGHKYFYTIDMKEVVWEDITHQLEHTFPNFEFNGK